MNNSSKIALAFLAGFGVSYIVRNSTSVMPSTTTASSINCPGGHGSHYGGMWPNGMTTSMTAYPFHNVYPVIAPRVTYGNGFMVGQKDANNTGYYAKHDVI